MLKKLLFTGITLSLFSLVGCSDEQSEEKGKTKILADQVEFDTNEIESLQTQNQFLNERNQYLVTTIKQVIDNLSDVEMLEFSQDQILYGLRVNGESIPKNGQVTISSGDIEILLSEEVLGYDFLPAEWLDKGKISGNYIDHLLNIDTKNWMPIGTDGTVNTAQGYQLADIKAGQFSFNITEELRERLKMDTNLIQIEVK
ncbi:hypothetical protein F7731_25330 [Cytobacillus depressus]|uniref:Uncharacterized protein n=1 Tax=Cytobacillus depressus TaxID=1602942 RepID=A0A6L3UX71_9BACI|nr:hypothetical protein [Cytobacillus depressus]KAB2328547.1 hypothetical protein F7731_25330 [Cytobacillus depressus]